MVGEPQGSSGVFALSTDGTELAAVDAGSGPAIVVVHGAGDSAGAWGAVIGAVSAEFRVVALERRMYGRSGTPRSAPSVDREVEDVIAVIDAVGGPCVVVGHSGGAVVALETALARPELTSALVLYEPALMFSTAERDAFARAEHALADGDRAAAALIFLRDVAGAPPEAVSQITTDPQMADHWVGLQAVVDGTLADGRTVIAAGQRIDRYDEIAVPTLLIGGSESPTLYGDSLDALQPRLRRVERAALHGHNHIGHVTAPDQLAGLITEFAARHQA